MALTTVQMVASAIALYDELQKVVENIQARNDISPEDVQRLKERRARADKAVDEMAWADLRDRKAVPPPEAPPEDPPIESDRAGES